MPNKLVDGGASSPATATPSQFPLKCCAFPGAETARKQFLLRGGKLPSEEIAANPAYTPPDSIEAREGCGPDELSRVCAPPRRWPGRPPFRRGAFRVRAVYHSGSAFARRFDYIAGRFCPLRHKTAHLYRRADFLHFTFLQFAHIINHEGHEPLRTCRGARRRG